MSGKKPPTYPNGFWPGSGFSRIYGEIDLAVSVGSATKLIEELMGIGVSRQTEVGLEYLVSIWQEAWNTSQEITPSGFRTWSAA